MKKRSGDEEALDPSEFRPDYNFWFKVTGVLLGGIGIGLTWWMTVVWADTQTSKSDIANLKSSVAVIYAKVDSVSDTQKGMKTEQTEMRNDIKTILRELRERE